MKLEIVPVDKKLSESTKDVLEKCIKADYESVIVFGFKDGEVETCVSEIRSLLMLIGALESAKCMVMHQGGYGEV